MTEIKNNQKNNQSKSSPSQSVALKLEGETELANKPSFDKGFPNKTYGVPKITTAADLAETSMVEAKRIGLFLAFIVFGIFGLWAAIAPIDGAARASAQVTVKSYKRVIQHLEGGIVESIDVQNGDNVKAGEPLLKIDNTQSSGALEIVNSQYLAMKARETRLIAERDGLDRVSYSEIPGQVNSTSQEEEASQRNIFDSRRAAREGNIAVLEQRIEQLKSRIIGLDALKESKETLSKSYEEELGDINALLDQGFSNKTLLRQAARNLALYQGEAAQTVSSIATAEVEIGQTKLEILQINHEFQNQTVAELAQVQTALKDLNEQRSVLADVVSRTVIKAPVAGIVNGMQIHTIGGVIQPGTVIGEIVPIKEELIIEAKVSPLDIDRVFAGQEALIRFPSFGNRTPTVYGTLLNLSADAHIDNLTGTSHYLARIDVDPSSLAELGTLELIPGMPAEVFISTGARTLMQYMFKPLSNGLARSFIED